MRALWIVGRVVKRFVSGDDPEQVFLACPLASARLRTAVAALEWKRSGNETSFWYPGTAGAGQSIDWESTRICVVSKFSYDAPLALWLDACLDVKRNGCWLVIDVCDYPFHKEPVIQTFYSEVLKISDAVVVNSECMAELMAPHTSHRPLVIEDAILGIMRNPEFTPGERLELLWFGQQSNLRFLYACIDALVQFAMQRHCRLTVVTNGGHGAEELTQDIQAHFAPAFEARFVQWSLEATRTALHTCDLVLIPSDPADPHKAGASANRIAEALNAGRFPIASPLPSYLPFADTAWLGQDLVQGVEWALANRGEVLARIRRGQALIAEHFAADKIGRQWRELFEGLVTSRDH